MGFNGACILATCLTTLGVAFTPACALAEGEARGTAILDRATVPAQGRQNALLTVDAFGRYAVTVNSAQGVALQAVDRMAGTGPVHGEPGKRDGRLDLFLDRGETRIVCHAAANGSGEAKLTAQPFRETHARPPMLVEQRLEQSSLDDFEQRSYWLDIKEERVVALEAAGRHLADLRLWRDGTWLIDAQPEFVRNQANPNQPLGVARLTATLKPGLYLLTAYGGPSQAWAKGSTAKPFYLRWGVRDLPAATRLSMVMNDLGIERFRVPAGPTFFRLELPSAREASLRVGTYVPESTFNAAGTSATISKKSTPPVAELGWYENGTRLVTVQAPPGQPYVLQHFEARNQFQFDRPGRYWLASVHAGHADDAVGASAVLTRQPWRGGETYLDDRALVFKAGTQWRRRFNLLDTMTMFVKLPESSKIAVRGQGVKAHYRFEPFLTSRPANYKPPEWQDSGHVFELDAGLHVLTVQPFNKGILDLHLETHDLKDDLRDWLRSAKSLVGVESKETAPAWTPVVASTRFPALDLAASTTYRLYLNQQPGVASGVVLRELPVDIAQTLPVTQRPRERLTIPVKTTEAGTLRAVDYAGKSLEMTLGDGRKGHALGVAPGQYQVSVEAGKEGAAYTLSLEPTRIASGTPLPALPDARLASLPKFPIITPDSPRYLGLGRQAESMFSVRVSQPGLYRFESTGLLQTGGNVRTRVKTELFSASANGIGRNFLMQRYLREGEYQLSVATQGETRGDLGVRVVRTDLIDGGELRPGDTARAMLASGRALAYRLHVAKSGRYQIRALGLGRNFAMRIEDEQGWPLDIPSQAQAAVPDAGAAAAEVSDMAAAAPEDVPEEGGGDAGEGGEGPPPEGEDAPVEEVQAEAAPVHAYSEYSGDAGVVGTGDVTLELQPGVYRAIILPMDMDTRVLTVFERLPEARRIEGHGPHRLDLDTPVRHVWQEPFKGQPRISDHWRFSLPAAAELSIGIDAGMEANLYDGVDRKRRLMYIPSGQPWRGTLPAGSYLLRVRHARGDSQVEYTLSVASKHLLAGQSRVLQAPAKIPLSVAGDGLVVLQSLGASDVRAKLFDASGAVIAQNDDQDDDWNFHIARRLAPGFYTLAVEPSGVAGAVSTTIAMRAPREIQEAAPALGSDIEIADAHVHVYPLAPAADANLLLASARAALGVVLALEAEAERGWVNLGVATGKVPDLPLLLDRARYKAYRLRVWSPERRGLPVQFRVAAGNLPRIDEAHWLAGDAPAAPIDAGRAEPRAALIALARPGSFRIGGDAGAWRWTDSPARAAEAGNGEVLSISGDTLLLVAESGGTLPRGERLDLAAASGQALRLRLGAGQTGQVDASAGAVGPMLALARSHGAQPGIAFGPDRQIAAMGISPNQAVAVRMQGAATPVEVWNAASATEPMDVDVSLATLTKGPETTLRFGAQDLTLKAGEARPCILPAGMKSIGLAMDGAVLAVMAKAGDIVASHWSGGDASRDALRGDAEQLWLLNTGAGEVTANIEIAAATPPDILQPGGLIERNMAGSGRLRIPVALADTGGAGVHLRMRGDARAIWQEAGGRVVVGEHFTPRADGALWLTHGPGPLLAWLDASTNGVAADAGMSARRVAPPTTLALAGKKQLLAFRFAQPAMLHARAEAPMVSQYLLPGQAPRTEASLHGASLNLMVPAKEARLLLRALGGAELSGDIHLHSTPAQPLDEGLGPEVLLQPGGARLFEFETRREAAIGIGIRATSDVARGALYDSDGVLLGEGTALMPNLKPGRYFLSVEIPADSPPVRARPVLLGIRAPDTRPPQDILRLYVEAGEDAPTLIHDPSLQPELGQAVVDADAEEIAGDAGPDTAEE